ERGTATWLLSLNRARSKSRDALCASDERGAAALEANVEVASGKVDEHVTVSVRRGRHCDRTRARRLGLPHPSFPDSCRHLARAVDARDLDVRAVREPIVRLQQRPEARYVRRIPDHDRVWVPDRDRDEDDAGELLRRPYGDLAELLRNQAVVEHLRRGDALADGDGDVSSARPLGKPGSRDSRSVPGQLGERAVWIPDQHVETIARHRKNLDDAIGLPRELASLIRVELLTPGLDENVGVTESAPGRGWHPPPVREDGRRRSSRSPGSAASTCVGTQRTAAFEPRACRVRPRGRESRAPRAP